MFISSPSLLGCILGRLQAREESSRWAQQAGAPGSLDAHGPTRRWHLAQTSQQDLRMLSDPTATHLRSTLPGT